MKNTTNDNRIKETIPLEDSNLYNRIIEFARKHHVQPKDLHVEMGKENLTLSIS